MSKISFLSDQVINQIAAGEVIENPASAIKELVENSIDAHATRIFVSIKAGGKQLICVEDDGDGMDQEDLLLSIERHATSKIQIFDDLQTVKTFGFRGEALASIAAVAKVKIESAKTDSGASLLLVEGGKILSIEPSARKKGTTIEIGSLFYNVPVRKEFQKSIGASTSEVIRVMTKLALAYPEIEFQLTSQDECIFHTQVEETSFFLALEKRIQKLLKSEFFSQSQKLFFQEKDYQFYGYLADGEIAKKNRIGQYLFVNRRAVYSPAISHCIKQAYGTRLQEGFFPAFVLHIEIPFSLVDVNVHPQKKEVRFKEEKVLLQRVYQAVKNSLERPSCLTTSFTPSTQISSSISVVNFNEKSYETFSGKTNETLSQESLGNRSFAEETFPKFAGAEFYQQKELLENAHFSSKNSEVEIVFLLGNYLLVEGKIFQKPLSLVAIDLQKAYARILFEKIFQNLKEPKSLQALAIPWVFDFSYEEIALIETHKEDFLQMGIECRILGEKTVAIDAVLEELNDDHFLLLFQEILEEFSSFGKSESSQIEKEKKLAQTACRIAKQRRKIFHREEAKKLVEELCRCQDLMRDPLGEKIWVSFAEADLASFFTKSGLP